MTVDVQAALTLIGSLPHRDLHLENVALIGANLVGLNFAGATFRGVTLRDVNATGANLTGATLSDVSMTDAVLDRALRRADLPADRVLRRREHPDRHRRDRRASGRGHQPGHGRAPAFRPLSTSGSKRTPRPRPRVDFLTWLQRSAAAHRIGVIVAPGAGNGRRQSAQTVRKNSMPSPALCPQRMRTSSWTTWGTWRTPPRSSRRSTG